MSEEMAAAITGRDGSRGEVGADDLAEGLLLVRASAIKVVRFQLALERDDRRVALETVDDLVLLDRRIENFLSDIPRVSESVSALEHELQAERRALAQEKFTLAAGTDRRIEESPPAPHDVGAPVEPLPESGRDLSGPAELDLSGAELFEPGANSKLLALGLVLSLLALAATLFSFLADSGTPFARGA